MQSLYKDISIRQLTLSEVELLTCLTAETFKESWQEEGNEDDLNSYICDNFNADVISNELSDRNIAYLIIEINNQLAAYLKLQKNLQPEGFSLVNPISICRLYVKKEYQNRSLGSILINEALLYATKGKFTTIWLGVWNKNPSAIRLYERNGFKIFGTYKFIMGNEISDDFLMKRIV